MDRNTNRKDPVKGMCVGELIGLLKYLDKYDRIVPTWSGRAFQIFRDERTVGFIDFTTNSIHLAGGLTWEHVPDSQIMRKKY